MDSDSRVRKQLGPDPGFLSFQIPIISLPEKIPESICPVWEWSCVSRAIGIRRGGIRESRESSGREADGQQ